MQLLRVKDIEQELRISRTTTWWLVKVGAFPPPLRIAPKAIAWRRSDIEAW